MIAARASRRLLMAGLGVIFCSTSAVSQSIADCSIHGVIFQPDQRMAPYVLVTLRNLLTGETRRTLSTNLGTYNFPQLVSGRYSVTVTMEPFEAARVYVTAEPNTRTGVDIRLRLKREEQVDVWGPAPADGQLTRLSSDRVDSLFLSSGRTLQSLVTLVPGIVVTETVGTLAQFSAVGQRRFSNRLTIDGISADLAADIRVLGIGEAASGALPAVATSGGTQTLAPLDAIGEVEVRTINATTAYAETPGAQTSIVTRAGTDRFRPTAFAAMRPDRLSARDWFSNAGLNPRREVHYGNIGASAGGPVLPGRLFYHAAWEHQHVDRPVTTTVQVPSLWLRMNAPDAVRQLFDTFPQPNGPENNQEFAGFTHQFPLTSSFSVVSVRSDLRLTDNVRAFVRLNRGHSHGDAVTGLQAPAPTYTGTETALIRTATAGVSVSGSKWVNEARFNVSTHDGDIVASRAAFGNARPMPYSLLAPATSSENDTLFRVDLFPGPGGIILSGPAARSTQTQAQLTDTWSIAKGRHSWTVGVDFRQIWNALDPPADFYSFRLRTAKELLTGQSLQMSIGHNVPARVGRRSWSAFVEHTMRLTPDASINLGFRYRVQPPPADRTGRAPLLLNFEALPKIEERANGRPLWPTQMTLAPRAAVTYRLGGAGNHVTTLRTGWGLVFDELTSPGLSPFGNGYPYAVTVLAGPSPFPTPEGLLESTDVLPAPFEAGTAGHYYAIARHLRSPRTHAWHSSIDRALGRGQQLSIMYAGTLGHDLIYRHEYFDGPAHIIHAYSNDAASNYHALLVAYMGRMSRDLQGRFVYTWSRAIDNDSGEGMSAQPPVALIPLRFNRGAANFDRRHVLHGWLSYRLPGQSLPAPMSSLFGDWQIDASVVAESSPPVSVTVSRTLGTGSYIVRPDIVDNVPVWLDDPGSPGGRRLNPAAFSNTQEARQGTLRRNAIRGFPLRQLNVAVSRRLPLGKRARLDLRVEIFNVLNVPSFGPPNETLSASAFGRPLHSYAETLGTGGLSTGGLIPVHQAGGPRTIQLGLRLGL